MERQSHPNNIKIRLRPFRPNPESELPETPEATKASSLKGKFHQRAFFETNLGSFEVELFAKACPEGVIQFVHMVEQAKRENSFGGLTFYHIEEGEVNPEVCMAGPTTGAKSGGPNSEFGDEVRSDLEELALGMIRKTNLGPDLEGPQYFLTLHASRFRKPDRLPYVLGIVIQGKDVVEKMGTATAETHEESSATGLNKPLKKVILHSITIH